MTSLGRILERLSPGALAVVHPPDEQAGAADVRDVVIFDGVDPSGITEADIVLGIGLRTATEVIGTTPLLRSRRPAALVIRGGIMSGPELSDCPFAVLALPQGGSWMALTTLLREAAGGDDQSGAFLGDSLFDVANAIADLIGAPVTIEDPQSHVLAFSHGQENADEVRRQTILGRRGPEEQLSRMRTHGVFKKLRASTEPLFVPGRAPGIKPRAVVPVRAGEEFLGSIWAVVDGPLDPERERVFASSAPAVALQLLRTALASEAWRSAESTNVGLLVAAAGGQESTVQRMGISAAAYQLVAVSLQHPGVPGGDVALLRAADALRLSMTALHRGTALGRTGDVVYAVVPLTSKDGAGRPDPGVRAALDRFLEQSTSALASQMLVALPVVVATAAALPRAREQADRVLAVLRRTRRTGVGDVGEVGAAALIDVLAEAVDRDPDLGADGLRRLNEYDAAKGTQFAETMAAWLDAFGETEIAAARLYVHPNTVRYRIRQLRELELVALDDPVERLALLVHLHRARLRTVEE